MVMKEEPVNNRLQLKYVIVPVRNITTTNRDNNMTNREEMMTIIEAKRYQCEMCIGKACWTTYKDILAPLLFCNHHMNANRDALKNQGWTITEL